MLTTNGPSIRGRRRRKRVWRISRQRVLTAEDANPVHVSLGEHAAQPGRQTAAPVEILEVRATATIPLGEPEQLTVQRVGQVARTTRWVESAGGPVEHRAKLAHEVFPRRFVPLGARARKRKVFEMQRTTVSRDLSRRCAGPGERLLDTAVERPREGLERHAPPLGPRVRVEPLNCRGIQVSDGHPVGLSTVVARGRGGGYPRKKP